MQDFNAILDNLKQNRRQTRAKQNSEDIKESQEAYQKIEDRYFNLLKDFTILTGTVFASSIALSIGKIPNYYFILGEFFLLIAVVVGVIILWSQLKSAEWSHFMDVKTKLEGDLIVNKDIMEDFEKKTTEDLVKSYTNLMKKNQKSILTFVLRIIKIDYFPSIFFIFLIGGVLLVFLSILNPQLSFLVKLIK